MQFFNKIKIKLKVRNLIWAIFFIIMVCIFCYLTVLNGFSSELQWQIGLRGSRNGIPVPNWLVSSLYLVLVVIFFASACSSLKSFIKDTEFNNMIRVVASMGNVDANGLMLETMKRNKLAKGGDLRFNEMIIFYMKGTDINIVPARSVRDIKTEIVGYKGTETNFVCVYYGNDVLKIKTSEKNVLLLKDEMRKTLRPV